MINRLLHFFFPRCCVACGTKLAITEEHFCLKCLRGLPVTNFHKKPASNFTYNLFKLQIPIERAASFLRYMPNSRYSSIIKEIKYHEDRKLGVFMGRMMAEEFSKGSPSFFEGIDMIVPVPITKKRLRERGYNQAELLAMGISAVTGIPIASKSVKRTHFSKSQTRTNKIQRRENVADVFSCLHPEQLAGKHILLLDDVITTGATLLALAHCIEEKADGVRFSVLSLGITNELALL